MQEVRRNTFYPSNQVLIHSSFCKWHPLLSWTATSTHATWGWWSHWWRAQSVSWMPTGFHWGLGIHLPNWHRIHSGAWVNSWVHLAALYWPLRSTVPQMHSLPSQPSHSTCLTGCQHLLCLSSVPTASSVSRLQFTPTVHHRTWLSEHFQPGIGLGSLGTALTWILHTCMSPGSLSVCFQPVFLVQTF